MKINAFDMFMKIMCLFPIFTAAMDIGAVNKLLMVCLFVPMLLLMMRMKINIRLLAVLLMCMFLYMYTLFRTRFPMNNINLLFYFLFTVIYHVYYITEYERFDRWFFEHRLYIRGVLICWTVMVGISFLFPSSYYVKEGGELYFGSFAGSTFRLGPTAIFMQILSLIAMAIYKKKYYFFFMLVPMCCYFMGSSRTYLVVGALLFIVGWYWFGEKRWRFWISIVPIIIVAGLILLRSNIWAKILYTLDDNRYGDFWFRLTSSRSVFWSDLINAWTNESIFNKLFGSGLEFSYNNIGLWAHNDFLEIITSFGIFGLLVYIYLIRKTIMTGPSMKETGFVVAASVFMVWFFNAFFNMHYTYFCALLSYPLIFSAFRAYYRR